MRTNPAFGAPSPAGATRRYGAGQAERQPAPGDLRLVPLAFVDSGGALDPVASARPRRRSRVVGCLDPLGEAFTSGAGQGPRELPAGVRDHASPAAQGPRVPRSAKIAVAIAAVWVISPIDLIPEFLPVIGPLDNVVVVALALRFAARRVPPRRSRKLGRASEDSSTACSAQQRPHQRIRNPTPAIASPDRR